MAAAGLYGLVAYSVSRRTNEIGLRMALGAVRRDILLLVLRESILLAATGVLFGLAASAAFARTIRGLLYGITSSDPIALSASCLVMAIVSVLAGYIPALRASRVDPAAALRQQ